jgi:hypothetical protein
MSTLTEQTIDLYGGEGHILSVAVTKSGVVVNIATGHNFTFEAKRVLSTETPDIVASSIGASPAITITNGPGGLAQIALTTTLLAWKTAYGGGNAVSMTYDLWDSATPEPIATGPLILRRLPQS